MKKPLSLPLLALALLLGACSPWAAPAAAAEELKPVAVLSLSGYDEVMGNLAFIGKLAERPELPKRFEEILKWLTQGEGLAGVDKTRPWGAVVQTDGREFSGYAFLPVTDLKKLLAVLEPYIGPAKETGSGTFEIKRGPRTAYIQQKGGWALVADRPDILASVPADPSAVLGGLSKEYHTAATLHVANVPARYRDQVIAGLKALAERAAKRRPRESEGEYAVRSKVVAGTLQALTALLADLDQVSLGWKLDRQAEKTFLDFSFTVKEGTETARQLEPLGDLKSNFAGFRVPGAAFSGNWVGKVPESRGAAWTEVLEAVRAQALLDIARQRKPSEDIRLSKQLVNEVADLLVETAKSGRADGGVAVLVKPESGTVLAGAYVADGNRVDKLARWLTEIARKGNPTIAGLVKLDADQHQGVRFHTMAIPIPAKTPDGQLGIRMVGEKLDLVVGIGPQGVYVAAGRDALKRLKEAIDKSAAAASQTAPLMQLSVALGPICNFSAWIAPEGDRPTAQWLAAELAKTPEADHINLVVSSIPRGVKYRLEVEGGILKVLGRVVAAAR